MLTLGNTDSWSRRDYNYCHCIFPDALFFSFSRVMYFKQSKANSSVPHHFTDGINSIKYKVETLALKPLFTYIKVNPGKSPIECILNIGGKCLYYQNAFPGTQGVMSVIETNTEFVII